MKWGEIGQYIESRGKPEVVGPENSQKEHERFWTFCAVGMYLEPSFIKPPRRNVRNYSASA